MNRLDDIVINFAIYRGISGRDTLYNLIQSTSLGDIVEALLDYYTTAPPENKYFLSTEKADVLISNDRILIVNK